MATSPKPPQPIPPYIAIGSTANIPPGGPFPAPSDAAFVQFYVTLGLTLARWQLVEQMLYMVFNRAVGAFNDALAAAFHRVPSFSLRLDMVDNAMQQALKHDAATLAAWGTLYNKLSKKAKRRNDIAHGAVYFDPSKPPGKQMFLAPNAMNPAKFSGTFRPGEIIPENELVQAQYVYDGLRAEIVAFQADLIAALARPPTPPEPPTVTS